MFTGIIEETGDIVQITHGLSQQRLTIRAHKILKGLAVGDSIAVNGCCLTAVAITNDTASFDLLTETLGRTTLGRLKTGDLVNLERSLRFDGRFGGHFVSGHIDTVGEVAELEQRDGDLRMTIRVPSTWMRYLVNKGCVSIDGVSLTVTTVQAECFSVWLIPHTLAKTILGQRQCGDPVNLECDLLAKYVEKQYNSTLPHA